MKDILAYSTSTSFDEDVEPIELAAIIKDIEENMYPLIRENDATISFVNLPVVMGSKVRLYQLFQNLISNAIKFKKDKVSPFIKIKCNRLASGFEIVVEDNGIGIESAYLDNVFNLFTKLNTKHDEGSGIGLATCRKITKEMGGATFTWNQNMA